MENLSKNYLSCVNINGMKKEGPEIIPVGQGDSEKYMIDLLLQSGYNGPWGILGHVEDELRLTCLSICYVNHV